MNPDSADLPEVSSINFGIETALKPAGRLKYFLPEWRGLTSDSQILKTVKGFNVILNLKNLNQYISNHHFKMESLTSAVCLMTPGCYMASVDLQDACYSVPVDENYQKYLKFSWKGELFQFTCLPNGLASAPRLFTKLLKPVYSTLRQVGHMNVGYIDDSYLQGPSFDDCSKNVQDTVQLFNKVGFLLNKEKSILIPSYELTFLGFVLRTAPTIVTAHTFCASRDTRFSYGRCLLIQEYFCAV